MHTTPLSFTKKPTGIWMHILVYCLIIGSDCILFCYNKNRELVQLGQVLMVLASILFICLALLKSKGKVKPNYIFLFITIVAVLFTAAFHGEFSGGYISLIALLSMGTVFFDVIDAESFKKALLNVMTAVCIVSLITFVLSPLFLKLSFFPSIYNSLDREYKFFFLSNILVIDPTRNYGIFTEPSRFQAYLNLCLIFLMFDRTKKLDIKRIALFVITLLTTLSTTGFLAFAIIVAAFLLSQKVKMQPRYKIALLAGLGVAVIVLFFCNEDFAWAIEKVFAGESSKSASTRFNSFYANIKMLMEYFPIGTGIQNAPEAFTSALDSLGNLHASTNTITYLVYYVKFGVMVGIFYTINIVKSIRNMANGSSLLLLFLAFIAMTCGISMVESIIFSIIIFFPQTHIKQID